MKKLAIFSLASVLTLSLAVQTVAMAEEFDNVFENDENSTVSSQASETYLEVGNVRSGTIDLTRLRTVSPPMKLVLGLKNSSDVPVRVTIADLDSSFLVPPRTERVHYLSTTAQGYEPVVEFQAEPILTAPTQPLSLDSIQYILDGTYTSTASKMEDGRRYFDTTPSRYETRRETTERRSTVRGYW